MTGEDPGHLIVISAGEVRRHLDGRTCIDLMRKAMTELSEGRTIQPLRSIVDLQGGNMLGLMPGAVVGSAFGAKIVSVFPGNLHNGERVHQGAILLFEGQAGRPVALIEAGEVTAIRTASASAAATDQLARPDARRLTIFGTGEQALQHARAIPLVRPIERITIWGRSDDRAHALARQVERDVHVPVTVQSDVGAAAADADIICTTTASSEPFLLSEHVREGAHINLVGSSRAGPVEIEPALVARARFIADFVPGVLAQGAEYHAARDAGLIDETHIIGEIGEVMNGSKAGRLDDKDITIYKSLGHVVQDLACGLFLYEKALADRFGAQVPWHDVEHA